MMEHDRVVVRHKTGLGAALKSAAPMLIVCLAGLGVMVPVLLLPYALDGHDFWHHILRLIALDQQVRQGNAFPLRFPDYSHGYGLATLSYYPPLAYFIMEAAHLLGANYLLAYQVTFLMIVLGAAFASYYLAARLFNRGAAVAVSIAYLYNPYFLMEVWTRGAVTVLLSLAAVPFLFAAIHRVTTETGWRGYVEASLAVALLILAHPLTTLYFAPFLAAWAVLCLVLVGHGRRWRAMLILAGSAVTGALLTSFYWLPAQLESSARQAIDLAVALQEYVRDLKPIGQVVGVSLTTIFRWKETVPIFSVAVLVLPAICTHRVCADAAAAGQKRQDTLHLLCHQCGGGRAGDDHLGPAAMGEVRTGGLSAVSLALARAAGPVHGAHHRRQSQRGCAGRLTNGTVWQWASYSGFWLSRPWRMRRICRLKCPPSESIGWPPATSRRLGCCGTSSTPRRTISTPAAVGFGMTGWFRARRFSVIAPASWTSCSGMSRCARRCRRWPRRCSRRPRGRTCWQPGKLAGAVAAIAACVLDSRAGRPR